MTRGEPSAATRLFIGFLRRKRAGESVDFDALCAEHPESAEELHELKAEWDRGATVDRAAVTETSSLAERIASQLGDDVDPRITLEEESAAEPVHASEVLGRLAQYGGLQRYRLKDEVGRGGMGRILRVWDQDLRRHLAMKVISKKATIPATPPGSSKHLARFLEEAQVTSQLDHPGIVPVHELGLDDVGHVYFTMKLVKGRTLRDVIELANAGLEGWSRTRVVEVVLKVCDAMAYAHDKGVIHRDLKPANVMVGRFGAVYVMDWGLARILDRADSKDVRLREPEVATSTLRSVRRDREQPDLEAPLMTMDGDVVGTPAYMSPEQAEGRVDAMGPQADVYSVGAILYHALAGHLPYVRPGTSANNYAIWHWVRIGPPEPLHEVAPDVPAELISICEKAMAREPAERYASMEALAEDLRAFLEGRVVGAYETGVWAETRKWVRRNRPLAASLAGAFVLLVAGLATALVLREQAVDNALRAEKNEDEAEKQAGIARRRAEDVLSLSAFQELEDLEKEADELWPPHPEHLEAYDAWIASATELVSGLDPDPSSDDVGHRARLAALRERALPRTEAHREADRRGHPRYVEIGRLKEELAARREAQDVRAGKALPTEPRLDADALPPEAEALLGLARPLVDPQRTRFGQEVRGLAIARLARERVEDDASLARANELVAWALFATGQDALAMEEMAAAVDLAPDRLRNELARAQTRLLAAIETAASEEGEAMIAGLTRELARLEEEVAARRTWRFADADDRWWHEQLSLLVEEIEAFDDPETGLWKGISPDHGWGVERRRAFAARVEERTVAGTDVAARWADAARRVVKNEKYAALVLEPQLGLVPVGPDPESRLEEFGHPLTGNVPERDEAGRLVLTEDTSLVFVLLPGGDFWMGAQRSRPEGRNYYRLADNREGPVHLVTLSPFFLSKFEMTQGQWQLFTGHNPSTFDPGRFDVTLSHPVEQVSWFATLEVCERMGLSLPTEAQWEYGARGGTTTPWWTGADAASIGRRNAGNLADQRAARVTRWAVIFEAWDDGHVIHAPIGSFAANPFGLHDVHGNVWEWCLDGQGDDFYAISSRRDPVKEPSSSLSRMYRGGGFNTPSLTARSSARSNFDSPGETDGDLGLRPARSLTSP